MTNQDGEYIGTSTGTGEQISETNLLPSGPLNGVELAVIGGGFVGCVAAAGFASFGHDVICVERDAAKLAMLQDGRLPFYERDLEALIKSGLKSGRLRFVTELGSNIEDRKAFFVAVGTPSQSDGRADLGAIEEMLAAVAPRLQPHQAIVIKSTVPVGTADRVRAILQQHNGKAEQIAVVSNPEFLREGNAVYDFFHPHRVVIGSADPQAAELVKDIYRLGMTNSVSFIVTGNRTAEMIKYASNAFLATKVGFINEIARFCDAIEVNVLEVAHAMGLDPRIGSEFLDPGPGWGGSCLPKDLSEVTGLAKTYGVDLKLLKSVQRANEDHRAYVVAKVEAALGGLQDRKIGILGIAFKAGTSDTRDSSAVRIIQLLLEAGARVHAFDPAVSQSNGLFSGSFQLAQDSYEALDEADCAVILTEWPEFQVLDWRRIAERMRGKHVIDGRNLLSPEMLERFGFEYQGMGQI